MICLATSFSPTSRFQSSRKSSFLATAELCRCAYHPCDGPHRPKGNACPFATKWPPRLMARALTCLDHLSRSIWQGLTAGAVADDDAQALAERLHARRGVL